MFSGFFPVAAFFAGVVSVLSPCILPVIPAVFAYSTEKGKFRPLAIVSGLSLSFTSMGIVTSIFGATLTAYLDFLYIFAEALLITMGISLLFDLNIFNFFGNFSSLANSRKDGLFGGLLLGLSLGIVWLPCVGSVLGSILTMVAVSGEITYGALMLFIYSIGFSIPMLLVAYSARFSSTRLQKVSKYGFPLKKVAGLIILGVGFFMVYQNHFGSF
ncbi:cytochrome C-type biogenesis protein (ccdA), conjectural [Methanosarcina siciliae C2J]|uniref:Cytochrome C-type biogenesis protein (CcdA), conjectural n=3 Tax=Methanosarcina siciliae TaxID=38027 RepID=A0A0E3PHD8_9EURY|nr:cytochrome c biogenesis CcdA family protein [Methanosarcina siciliae]AKB30013.1 cytochrome C-type biogenesis protein (ccdA), conjectural [Methanosarcina siciliae T4/M]AKB33913.1 cytochrome C-type biogenesis protein (ccdA), conjectural [Methanosarcina siciliae HI350]AKB38274.1 cytochrome C-type biogenesis protein (ccdA), conjectural [Methanosarcina siciliae C2J]